MPDVVHRGIVTPDQWIERQGPLRGHDAFAKVRSADDAEMQAQRERERTRSDDSERDRSPDLDAPVAAQPPYLVT